MVKFFEEVATEIDNNKDEGSVLDCFRPVLDKLQATFQKDLTLGHGAIFVNMATLAFFTRTPCLAEVSLVCSCVLLVPCNPATLMAMVMLSVVIGPCYQLNIHVYLYSESSIDKSALSPCILPLDKERSVWRQQTFLNKSLTIPLIRTSEVLIIVLWQKVNYQARWWQRFWRFAVYGNIQRGFTTGRWLLSRSLKREEKKLSRSKQGPPTKHCITHCLKPCASFSLCIHIW